MSGIRNVIVIWMVKIKVLKDDVNRLDLKGENGLPYGVNIVEKHFISL